MTIQKKPLSVANKLQSLRADITALKYTISRLKLEVRKISELRATINKCHAVIKKYEGAMKRRDARVMTEAKRMTEIEKDYAALFKMRENTITFFEKRNAQGDWISGEIGGSREVIHND